ncbi:peptide ABC transporter ATPase [Sulfuricella denitrificans skB26]|uniref:Peptide ABC transporter ATPase n=1 Tax=Sulfuricella denitrificans (strain DSM 22764 / NBRC 105220 / skB26) TaxID=1163617 RepID=S6B2U6_SULDS|nr:ABC transporter ATP-binding protein [Sulfuricella denitrificans]BAN34997.1 peptide ABC transporter ATPase [Sulfuricella denitrificans skB26]
MSGPLLVVENLRVRLDAGKTQVRAVDGVSFSIDPHETFALLGESGCGKSMTALSLMRLLPEAGHIETGKVLLDGLDLLGLPEIAMRAVRGKRIAMIFQEPMTSLNPVMTIGQQIAETLHRHTDLRGEAAQGRVLELLDAVGIPAPQARYHDYPFQFSGGMKQRVMIAIALACEPDLLIADEPTTALDVTIQAQVLELLRRLQHERGMAVMLISHDLGVVSEMAQRVAVMYAGEIVEMAGREEFFANPQHPYTRKLFASLPGAARRGQQLEIIRGSVPPLDQEFSGCRFAGRCDFAWQKCREEVPAWSEVTSGHQVRCHLLESPEHAACEAAATLPSPVVLPEVRADRPLLEVADLKVHFPIHKGLFKRVAGHVRAVDGVSLAIHSGRTLALVGESGCGKTTVGKSILQLIRPTAGSVRFSGDELTQLKGATLRARRTNFQIVFQDPYSSLDPRMRVADIIEEGMIALGAASSSGDRQNSMDRLLQQVGLSPDSKYRYPHEFSGGQRQRIAIARALAVKPQLIVCDEPTSALDVSVQAQILNLLKGLQDELGLAYLFITHNLAVVEYFAHEVAVMYLGRIVERGTVEEVMQSPRHPYTRALLSAVPVVVGDARREIIRLAGDLPSPANPPSGCHFHPRCPQAMAACRQNYPAMVGFSATHSASCYLYSEK